MLKILFLTKEVTPFSHTGRQGDLVAALAPAMKRAGHEIRVITPRYEDIRERKFGLREVARLKDLAFQINNTSFTASIKSGFIPCSKVQVYFIDAPLPNSEDPPVEYENWQDPVISALQLIHGALQLTLHLQWQPDIIYCCGSSMALGPAVIRNNPVYAQRFNDSRVIFHVLSDSVFEPLNSDLLLKAGLDTNLSDIFESLEQLARSSADSTIDPEGTIGEWLEFLTCRDVRFNDPPANTTVPTQSLTEAEIQRKILLQKKLGLHIEPDVPLVAMLLGSGYLDSTYNLLEAELPHLDAQFVAFGGDGVLLSRTEQWSNQFSGKVAAVHNEPAQTLCDVELAADILFVPHVDSNGEAFDRCRRFNSAIPLVTEDLFNSNQLVRTYQIPNYAHSFVFPSGETRSMIDALRKTTETYKKPLDWHELVQRGINRELFYEHIARNMAEEFTLLLEKRPEQA